MSKYKLIYLSWLLPAFLLFLAIHQALVYQGVRDTYRNGTSYTADIDEFELKQIAAQTNGYVILSFTTREGEFITRKLSLPVEMAGELQNINIVPIRYQPGAFQSIVMTPTYKTHKGLALTNIAMAAVGFILTFFIALAAHRYMKRKLATGEQEYYIERIDKHG